MKGVFFFSQLNTLNSRLGLQNCYNKLHKYLPNLAPILKKTSNSKLGKHCHVIHYHPKI